MHVVCPHCLSTNRLPAERAQDAPHCGRCHQPLLPDHPVALTDAQFDVVAQGTELPVVVDFWAPWCSPCQAFAPHFEATARAMRGRVLFVKVNSDENPKLSVRHRIRSIPTLLLLHRGEELQRASGAMSARDLQQWIERHAPREDRRA